VSEDLHRPSPDGSRRGVSAPRPRYALIAAAVAIIAVVATPALGIGHRLFHRLDSDPRLPGIVGSRAQKLVSVRTPAGEASLWIGPTDASGRCVFIHIGGTATGTPPAPNGGSQCDIGPSAPQSLPIATNLTWYPANEGFTLLVDGHVAAGSRITKIVLQSSAEARSLPLAKNYFLADLAVAPQGQLPVSGRPYVLVGYDKDGHEVSRVDLQRVAGTASS
jgi:hypothetical protein